MCLCCFDDPSLSGSHEKHYQDPLSNVYDLGDAFNGPFGEVDADEVDEVVVDQGGWKLPSAGDRG